MKEKLYFLDLSLWKRTFLKKFFPDYECIFTSKKNFLFTVRRNTAEDGVLTAVIWSSYLKNPKLMRYYKYLKKNSKVKIILIEDAFIRSLGLGSDFFYPYSISKDELGIYYNPLTTSTLEELIKGIKNRPDYNELIKRAKKLRNTIVEKHISKYYRCDERLFLKNVSDLKYRIRTSETQGNYYERIIFVPCQVDTDASVLSGGLGYDSLTLIKELRNKYPESCIIAKVHPDVMKGNRKNNSTISDYKKYANMVFTDEFTSLECIEVAEEIHTISSYTGFEALLRNKKVVCYGMPFYAGYGLTEDIGYKNANPVAVTAHERRYNREITVDDITAAAILLYPVYYNWDKNAISTPEEVTAIMASVDKTKQSKFFLIRHKIYLNLFIKPYKRFFKKDEKY